MNEVVIDEHDANFMWGVVEAVKKLRPNCKFTLYDRNFIEWEDAGGEQPPAWSEVEAVMEESRKIYEYLQYSRDRAAEYPDPIKQLDEIWHTIQSGTPIDQSSHWFIKIKAIKDKYPKP